MFKFTRRPNDNYGDFNEDDGYYDFDKSAESAANESDGFGMGAPAAAEAAPSYHAAPALSLKIISPKGYESASEIADHLMNGNTVLLNLETIYQDRNQTIRLLDYLSGAIHVCGGIMTKVGKTTIVVSPKNVDVSSIEAMIGGN
ncbi:MAG: cell division protein SepF [Clostridia bacterium]|nr:cell division protein SepF [Clostridia bacterium]